MARFPQYPKIGQSFLDGQDLYVWSGYSWDLSVITDVRNGVVYASGALTGTLNVPIASSVAVGVPADATVGTAIISITDMGALLASYNV
jgi:hypothetical protein